MTASIHDRRQAVTDAHGDTPLDRAWRRCLTGQQSGRRALSQAVVEAHTLLQLPPPPTVEPAPAYDWQDNYWTVPPPDWAGTGWRPV